MSKLIVNLKMSKVKYDLVKETLTENSETLFFQKILEMLRHRIRFENKLPYEGGNTATFTENEQPEDNGDPLVEELEYLVTEMTTEVIGDQQEDQPDEEYESLVTELNNTLRDAFLVTIDDILTLVPFEDLSGLIDFDFNGPFNMTWRTADVTTEEGTALVHLTFVLE